MAPKIFRWEIALLMKFKPLLKHFITESLFSCSEYYSIFAHLLEFFKKKVYIITYETNICITSYKFSLDVS